MASVTRLSIGLRKSDPGYPIVASYTKNGQDRKVSVSSYVILKELFVDSEDMAFEDFQSAVSAFLPTVHKHTSSNDTVLVARLKSFTEDATTDGVVDLASESHSLKTPRLLAAML